MKSTRVLAISTRENMAQIRHVRKIFQESPGSLIRKIKGKLYLTTLRKRCRAGGVTAYSDRFLGEHKEDAVVFLQKLHCPAVPLFWAPCSDRLYLDATLRSHFPDSKSYILRQSDEAINHRLNVFEIKGYSLGNPILWNADPHSNLPWPDNFFSDVCYRGENRLGDIKYVWEINKHKHLVTLGKAFAITGDMRFGICFVEHIDSWLVQNPPYTGVNWISSLEIGLRLINWVGAFEFFQGRYDFPSEFLKRFSASIHLQGEHISKRLSNSRYANTHLIGEAASLIVLGLFFGDLKFARQWLHRGMEVLEREIQLQVYHDSFEKEHSFYYHRFFLDFYLYLLPLLARRGFCFSPSTLQRIEEMSHVMMHLMQPDGELPRVGDIDDARGFPVSSFNPGNIRDSLGLAALLFKSGQLKAVSGTCPEDILWIYGEEGVRQFHGMPAVFPTDNTFSLQQGGYTIWRSGWSNERADYLLFEHGPMGDGPAGHSHADALSVVLVVSGRPALIDPGSYAYNISYPVRNHFRSTLAHNTITVDGRNQAEPAHNMGWASTITAHERFRLRNGNVLLVDAEHKGYADRQNVITHRRCVMVLRGRSWVFWDWILGEGIHDVQSRFHFHPSCTVSWNGTTEGLKISSHGYTMGLYHQDLNVVHELVHDDEDASCFSAAYGHREPSPMFMATYAGKIPVSWCTIVQGDYGPQVWTPVCLTAHDIECMVLQSGAEDGLELIIYDSREDIKPVSFTLDNGTVIHSLGKYAHLVIDKANAGRLLVSERIDFVEVNGRRLKHQ